MGLKKEQTKMDSQTKNIETEEKNESTIQETILMLYI